MVESLGSRSHLGGKRYYISTMAYDLTLSPLIVIPCHCISTTAYSLTRLGDLQCSSYTFQGYAIRLKYTCLKRVTYSVPATRFEDTLYVSNTLVSYLCKCSISHIPFIVGILSRCLLKKN